MKEEKLLEPIKIGNTLFRNRIFVAPTGHPDISVDGDFTDDSVSYFERKAMGGAATVTLGEAIVDSKFGKRHPFQLSLDFSNSRHSLARVADAIRRHGAVPNIELQHSGCNATPGIETPGFCVGGDLLYGVMDMEINGKKVHGMTEEEILEVIDKFANAAKMCQDCGFGMVLIHGGHGWLLNQFMAARLNKRTDRWGGESIENRARFAVEICDAIHRKCGRGFPVEFRISASEIINGGYDAHEGALFAQQLEGHADIIHCSVGCGVNLPDNWRDFSLTHPCMFKEDGVNVKYAAEVKKLIKNTPVACVGALSDPAMMEDIIATGKADIVEMARGILCDPDLPNKAREGRDEDIVKCMRCFSCFSNGMERGMFWCALNPQTNRERYFWHDGDKVNKKKVLVVGGGIGGMQAAITAAQDGHEVILCEKGSRLGGHIRCEENVPFKKHLREYIEQRERIIAASNIDLRLNTEVTPEYAKSVGADVIIAALGARPVVPRIDGIDGKNVMVADDAYVDPKKAGKSAVILGAGFVGTELAIYLNSLGVKVEIVEMADAIGAGNNFLHGAAVNIKLREEGIPVHFRNKAVKIDDKGVVCETPEGEVRYDAETVIYAVGQRPLTAETKALYDCAPRFYPIGDCVTPKTISDATLTGMSVARDLGRY